MSYQNKSDQEDAVREAKNNMTACDAPEINENMFAEVAEKDPEERVDKKRRLTGPLAMLVKSIGACYGLYVIAVFTVLVPLPIEMRAMHLFFSMVLGYMLYTGWKSAKKNSINVYDWLMIILSAVTSLYVVFNAYSLSARMAYVDKVSLLQLVFAGIFIILLLQLVVRVVGWPIAIIATAFSVYALLGRYMPGMFRHAGISPRRFLEYMYMTDSGIFGTTLATCSTYVATFILFGVFIEKSGAGDILLKIGLAIGGGLKGGPAKSAVFASSIMGTTMGSSIANVYCTGQFTIPLMKKAGFRPEKAGAIEAVASTCSQIMPPVMGSSAFLIADALGISYTKVCLAAIFPALLYCISIYCMVHLEAVKMNIPRTPRGPKGEILKLLKNGWFLLLPIVLLIYLLVLQYTAFYAALLCSGAAVVLSWFHPVYRMTPMRIIEALSQAGLRIVTMAIALSCAGITVSAIQVSGLGVKFSKILLSVAGGNVFPMLLLTAISCIILGMGLPASACYILTSLFCVPALIDMGFVPISAHMFIYNFAILAAITPPVAMAAYAGGELANAPLNKVGWNAFALGLTAYIVPFFYIFHPGLLLQGQFEADTLLTALAGIFVLSTAIQGWAFRNINIAKRVILFFSALLMFYANILVSLMGITVAAGIYAYELFRRTGRFDLGEAYGILKGDIS